MTSSQTSESSQFITESVKEYTFLQDYTSQDFHFKFLAKLITFLSGSQ